MNTWQHRGAHAALVNRFRADLCDRYKRAIAATGRTPKSLAPVFGVADTTAVRWAREAPPVAVVHWLEAVAQATQSIPVPELSKARLPTTPVDPISTL